MLSGSTGLGDFILATRELLACFELTAMVLMGLLGFALDTCARSLHRRWVHA